MRNVLLAACLVLVACTRPTGATPSPSSIADFEIGDDRPVTVRMPTGGEPGTAPGLLILLHGYSGDGERQESWMQLGPIADGRGLIYLHPDGTADTSTARFWNATDACCNRFDIEVDDSAYLAGLIDDVKARVAVDAKRIYIVGYSNGGFMSYRMACDHGPDRRDRQRRRRHV